MRNLINNRHLSMALATEPKRIALEGNTVDGRKIERSWLIEGAKLYDRDFYAALVFPNHDESGVNYGVVDSLFTKEENGLIALYGSFLPNAFWQSDVRFGQNAYTSIAVMPNFAKTGKPYIYSVGATNTPASLGVQRVEFAKKHDDIFYSQPLEIAFSKKDFGHEKDDELDDEKIAGWFKRNFHFFNNKTKEDEPMTPQEKEAFDKLSQDFAALKTEHEALKKGTGNNSEEQPTAEAFAALKAENDSLKTKVSELETKVTAFSVVETKLAELGVKFTEATKEVAGTKPHNFGANNTQAAEEYAAAV